MLTLAENLKRHRSPERAAFEDAFEQKEIATQVAPEILKQAEHNQKLAAIQDAEREEIIAGRRDPGFTIPESVAGLRMNLEEATKFSVHGAQEFYKSSEQFRNFYDLPENRAIIANYLNAQETRIADAACWHLAFERLRDLNLLTEKQSAPEVEPLTVAEPIPDPEELKRQEREKYYNEIVGADPSTGQQFTAYQLDRCDADTYRRVMRIPRGSNAYVPTVGDVLAMNRS